MISYKPLFKLLVDRDIKKKTDLLTIAGITSPALANLNKGYYVRLDIIDKICKGLNCSISDVIEYVEGEQPKDPKDIKTTSNTKDLKATKPAKKPPAKTTKPATTKQPPVK